MHLGMFSSVPGLYPLDSAASSPSFGGNHAKCAQTLTNDPWVKGGQNLPQLRTTAVMLLFHRHDCLASPDVCFPHGRERNEQV